MSGHPGPHFRALLSLNSTEADGRLRPIESGFRTNFDLGVLGTHNTVRIVFPSGNSLSPGHSDEALIYLVASDFQNGRLFVGMEFSMFEGSRLIGNGTILGIYDQRLCSEG